MYTSMRMSTTAANILEYAEKLTMCSQLSAAVFLSLFVLGGGGRHRFFSVFFPPAAGAATVFLSVVFVLGCRRPLLIVLDYL